MLFRLLGHFESGGNQVEGLGVFVYRNQQLLAQLLGLRDEFCHQTVELHIFLFALGQPSYHGAEGRPVGGAEGADAAAAGGGGVRGQGLGKIGYSQFSEFHVL